MPILNFNSVLVKVRNCFVSNTLLHYICFFRVRRITSWLSMEFRCLGILDRTVFNFALMKIFNQWKNFEIKQLAPSICLTNSILIKHIYYSKSSWEILTHQNLSFCKLQLSYFVPLFPIDPPENIKNQRFSNVFRGIKRERSGKKVKNICFKAVSKCICIFGKMDLQS